MNKNHNKKGQAALEFLMTYGWAILVVLVVIGALAYFGVLNPDSLVPDKCTLTTGISCDDFKVTSSDISLQLGNGMGRQIKITNISATQVGKSVSCLDVEINKTVKNGASESFTLDGTGCTITQSGRKPRFNLNVTYYYTDSASSYNHLVTGELLAAVQ